MAPSVPPFYKHLMVMECRKDILLENDFTNKLVREANTPLFKKYSQKIKNNKMRIAYLCGFSLFFSLNFAYDFIFQSRLYHDARRYLVERNYLPALEEFESLKVDYRTEESRKLGDYFLALEKRHPRQEVTASMLSGMIPAFSEKGEEILDVNSFVSFCLNRAVSSQDLTSLRNL